MVLRIAKFTPSFAAIDYGDPLILLIGSRFNHDDDIAAVEA